MAFTLPEGSVAAASRKRSSKRTDTVATAARKTWNAGGTRACGRKAHGAEVPVQDFIMAGPAATAKDGLDPWCAACRKGYRTEANPALKPRAKAEPAA